MKNKDDDMEKKIDEIIDNSFIDRCDNKKELHRISELIGMTSMDRVKDFQMIVEISKN